MKKSRIVGEEERLGLIGLGLNVARFERLEDGPHYRLLSNDELKAREAVAREARAIHDAPPPVEQTERRYKAGCLLGGALMGGGFLMWGIAGGQRADGWQTVAGVVMCIGIVGCIGSVFMGWWKNG